MATRKEKVDKKKPEESVLVEAAKAIGTVAGKIASVAGATADKPATKSMKIGKLLPKHKARLPRRQKKAQKKAATRL